MMNIVKRKNIKILERFRLKAPRVFACCEQLFYFQKTLFKTIGHSKLLFPVGKRDDKKIPDGGATAKNRERSRGETDYLLPLFILR